MVVKWEIYRNYKSTLREQLHLSLREKKQQNNKKNQTNKKTPNLNKTDGEVGRNTN